MVRRAAHAVSPRLDDTVRRRKKTTAVIALVAVGVFVGIAVGLGVGLSNRSSGTSDGATIEATSTAGNGISATNRGTGTSRVDLEDTSRTPDLPLMETNTSSTESQPCTGDISCNNGTTVQPPEESNTTHSTASPQESLTPTPTGAPGPDGASAAPPLDITRDCPSILEVALEIPELSSLLTAIEASGYTDILEDPNSNITVLAPSNSAFAKIPDEESRALLEDDGNLTQVLALHLIPEAVRQKGLLNGAQFSTFADESVTVVEGGSNTRFSAGGATARVTNADLLSCSGVVHVIDTILVAPDMYADDTSATGTGGEESELPEAMDPTAVPDTLPPNMTEAPPPPPLPVDAPPPPPPDEGPRPGPDKKWTVCIGNYGKLTSDDACGVRVSKTGRVTVGEYFGGFDGFFSFNPADSHENCFNRAVVRAFGLNICKYTVVPVKVDPAADGEEDQDAPGTEIVCEEPEDGSTCACVAVRYNEPAIWEQRRNWPGNKAVIEFLKELRDRADPIDFDFPRDLEVANNGGRASNQRKVEEAFTEMVHVREC